MEAEGFAALWRSANSFERLYASNLIGIMFADTEGTITEANDAFLRMVGYERPDLPLRWDRMTPPEWHTIDGTKVEEIRTSRIAIPWEKEYFAKDGHRVPILVGAAQIEGREGECVCFVLDLTDQKRSEAVLKRSEKLYRTLYEDIPAMYFSLDPDGVIRFASAYGAEQLGYDPSELIGRSVAELFHPADRRAARRHLRAALARPGKTSQIEVRKLRKDGSLMWVSEALRFVSDPDDEPAVFVVCRDITPRKKAEARLIETQHHLRALTLDLTLAAERERHRIAVGVHDEIGPGLALARMKLVDLEHGRIDGDIPRGAREIRQILEQAIRASRNLVFDLGVPALYDLGFDAAIRGVVGQLAADHGLEIRVESDRAFDALEEMFGVVLFRVARELLYNAVKHARANRVTVTLGRRDGHWEIHVVDDGIGFDTETTDRTEGFGLFSVRHQLRSFGGSLEIGPAGAKGTRCVARIPVAQDPSRLEGNDT